MPFTGGLVDGAVTAKIKYNSSDEICGTGNLHYYDNTNKHGTASQPGTWINFQYFGFKIFVSTVDW